MYETFERLADEHANYSAVAQHPCYADALRGLTELPGKGAQASALPVYVKGIGIMKKFRKVLLLTVLSLTGLCLLLAVISVISNLALPQQSATVETLSNADKVRLAEMIHLRQSVGDAVWPGWGQADIPAIAYNESYAFLVGYPVPPAGWTKVPQGNQRGGPWELVSGDRFNGQPYYRQPLPEPDVTPEGFTVLVGKRWVSSLMTFEWAKISLVQPIRQDLPPFVRPVFPYRLFLAQLLGGDDKYITLAAHEAFHAYQGMLAPGKLSASEITNSQVEDEYPWDDASLQAGWQAELDLLAEALRATDRARTAELARRFLEARATRRDSAGFSPELVSYEQQREWLEGLARYAELEIWRQAYAGDYVPLPETASLPDFDDYSAFETRWSQELDQIRRMAGDEGDGRFYYSGMAQAFLLDRLLPYWKERAFEEGVWLEDLLREA
jgi:hypothetical protein